MVVCLIKRQVGQVCQDREPEAFLYTQDQLLLRWVCRWFLFPVFTFGVIGAKTVLGGVVAHVLKVSLVEVAPMLREEKVDQVVIAFQLLSAQVKQFLGFLALMREHGVHGVFIETVDELDEVLLEKIEFLCDSDFEGLERLSDKHFFAVLSCQREDVDDYAPAGFDVGRLCSANVSYAHYDILFNLGPCCQVMQHDLLKRMQEVLLEVEACKLLLEKELIGELSKGVDRENGNVEVLVGAN